MTKVQDRYRVYVAGAYSGPDVITILDNMRHGMNVAHQVLKSGYAPFAPWMDYLFSFMGQTFLNEYYEYSIAWLKVSDAMLLVPGWEDSKGTKKEIEIAQQMGIPIFKTLSELHTWREAKRLEQHKRVLKGVNVEVNINGTTASRINRLG